MWPKQKKTLLGDKNVPRAIVCELYGHTMLTNLFVLQPATDMYINQLLIKAKKIAKI